MLFVVFVVSVAIAVGAAAFSYGALLGGKARARRFGAPVQRRRLARGSTPPPVDQTPVDPMPYGQTHDDSAPGLAGVISNREDATEPEVAPDARFSVTRASRPRFTN